MEGIVEEEADYRAKLWIDIERLQAEDRLGCADAMLVFEDYSYRYKNLADAEEALYKQFPPLEMEKD